MKVKYMADLGFYDGLVRGKIYEVIEETESQYIVKNELGGESKVQKSKFEIL